MRLSCHQSSPATWLVHSRRNPALEWNDHLQLAFVQDLLKHLTATMSWSLLLQLMFSQVRFLKWHNHHFLLLFGFLFVLGKTWIPKGLPWFIIHLPPCNSLHCSNYLLISQWEARSNKKNCLRVLQESCFAEFICLVLLPG